jgi:hypothetical protein
MFDPKIKVRKALLDKLQRAAEVSGCVSLEEFVEKILESEADRILLERSGKEGVSAQEVEDIANKLKGLGYLD